MADQSVQTDKIKSDRSKTDKTKKRPKTVDLSDFRAWLSSLDMHAPILHVNGVGFPTAVLATDFGTPLVEQKLTTDQNAELMTRLRVATKALYPDKEVNVRVQNDSATGVWWTSVG